MGNTITTSYNQIQEITDKQIIEIKKGTISSFSLQIFLKNFYFVSRYPAFYTDLPLRKIVFILENIGPLTKDECSVFVENYCLSSLHEDNLFENLYQISQKMICKTYDDASNNDVYLPVSLDQKLWTSIMQRKFKTGFGSIKITQNMIDWSNPSILIEREKFITEKQFHILRCPHSKELSMLIQNNPIDSLFNKELKTLNESLTKESSKPFFWETNLFEASMNGKISSVEYSLSLMPEMINLSDANGNTLIHYAALGNQANMLLYLHQIGADLSIPNNNGLCPIHLIQKKAVLKVLNSIGININIRNLDGESLLDIKTRNFDKTMIETLFSLDADIFEPNKNGTYWFQTAINKKYMGKMNEEEFREFIRKLLINNKTAPWNDNEIYKEIISRSDKDYIQQNIEDLAESVKRKDISRIKILLALGTEADSNCTETNLLYCAKNGMTDIATILLNNYCNPNNTNNQNENTFWVAAFNQNFNTALLLKKYGVKINTINKNKETLMHIVYQRNMNNVFEFLLKEGANPNIKNGFGETVTFIAFDRKDDEIAEILQDNYKGDINSQNNDMNTLVHLAFDRKDIQRIEYYKKRRIDMNLKNKKGHTVLMHAFFTGTNIENMKFLINLGSSINTTDNNNNTMLHHLLFQNNPSQSIFLFLKNEKIDFNIVNNDGQYPISIAIAKGHDKIGFDLLNSHCKLNNKTSVHEPIVEAIKRGSSKWVEALIDHGANALNEKVGVVSRYIKSGFFNFDIFKKILQMNILLEAPFQEAIYAKLNNCSLHIWNMAKNMNLCTKLAKNKDKHKRIPLSAAIMTKNDMLVKILLNISYDLQSSDEDGRTPFIYACMVDCYPWMTSIFSKILLSNANKVDRNDCSALSYTAFNNNKSFCEELFISNIEINNIKTDKYGIIESFRTILYKYEKIKKCAKQNYSDAKSALDQLQEQKKQFKEKLKDVEFRINIEEQDEYRIKHSDSVTEEEIKKFYKNFYNYKREKKFLEENLPKIKAEIDNARNNYENYKYRYQVICEATRKDMLQKLPYLEKLSIRDKKIVTLEFKKDDSDCVIC